MRITILETGRPPEALRSRFPDYPAMFEALLGAADPGLRFETVAVWDGAPLPDPAAVEAFLITGSSAGAYEDHPWIAPLERFIRAAAEARVMQLGICFGHQIMAQALGGRVEKSAKGWGVGRHAYALGLEAPAPHAAPGAFAIAASHQDQVVEKPPGAEVIAWSDHTDVAGLHYPAARALSLQGHPEMSAAFIAALVESRRGRIPDAVVDAALQSLNAPLDSARVARWLAAFLRHGRAG
jgi:GMP synthase-like glutamine amidotransferase